MNVTVVVATFGDKSWEQMARQRAIPAAVALGVPVLQLHGDTLHEARNEALGLVETEWVAFLDADDELERGYFDHMATGTADLRAPSVRYVRPNSKPSARVPRVAGHSHQCVAACLEFGNWLVVGTVARTSIVREVGGWRDWPMFEDFDLWARCWQAGATVEAIPRAVYRAHVRLDSRNRAPSRAAKLAAHQAIARANGLPVPA